MLEDAPRVWESAPGVHKKEQIVHCCLLQRHLLAAEQVTKKPCHFQLKPFSGVTAGAWCSVPSSCRRCHPCCQQFNLVSRKEKQRKTKKKYLPMVQETLMTSLGPFSSFPPPCHLPIISLSSSPSLVPLPHFLVVLHHCCFCCLLPVITLLHTLRAQAHSGDMGCPGMGVSLQNVDNLSIIDQ